MTMTSKFADMTSSSIFFDDLLFLLLTLVTGSIFMSISSLVLELWQFSFLTDWPYIRKLELTPSEFCPTTGDWGKLKIPNLVSIFQWNITECYKWGYNFYRFWVIKVKPTGRAKERGGQGGVITPLLSRLKLICFLVPGILSRSRK